MKIIQTISEQILEEISDAEKYAWCALKHKEDDQELYRTYVRLANEELSHSELLHAQAVRLVGEIRQKNGEPPASMMAVYEYLHNKAIEKSAEVRLMLSH